MDAALYATIWIALVLFVAAEAGKQRPPRSLRRRTADATRGGSDAARMAPDWAWAVWVSGAGLCTLHIALAFAGRHGWSHEMAVRETARQTAAVYGIAWGGGVYVNYVFVAAWLTEAWWWRAYPSQYFSRRRAITWTLRAFYLLIIVNAAVVFASVPGRAVGVVLVGALLYAWWPVAALPHPSMAGRRADPDCTQGRMARR